MKRSADKKLAARIIGEDSRSFDDDPAVRSALESLLSTSKDDTADTDYRGLFYGTLIT